MAGDAGGWTDGTGRAVGGFRVTRLVLPKPLPSSKRLIAFRCSSPTLCSRALRKNAAGVPLRACRPAGLRACGLNLRPRGRETEDGRLGRHRLQGKAFDLGRRVAPRELAAAAINEVYSLLRPATPLPAHNAPPAPRQVSGPCGLDHNSISTAQSAVARRGPRPAPPR